MNSIRPYVDVMGRTQKSVDGPAGTWLITRANGAHDRSFEVWKSDSLVVDARTPDPVAALEFACRKAGVEL